MKWKLVTGYIALFWLAIFLAGFWVFGILFRASPVPEFGVGLVGGVIYGLVMRALAQTLIESVKDFLEEWRSGLLERDRHE